ncbi:hypothetical protein N0O92_17360, partial [Alkalihalobacillus sp. MEB130]|uniref:hypothetical protein n=1 Tax=Alkalihalobacillus sp. MEB130 TaxID=2976704 RepID=UPI0028DE5782
MRAERRRALLSALKEGIGSAQRIESKQKGKKRPFCFDWNVALAPHDARRKEKGIPFGFKRRHRLRAAHRVKAKR